MHRSGLQISHEFDVGPLRHLAGRTATSVFSAKRPRHGGRRASAGGAGALASSPLLQRSNCCFDFFGCANQLGLPVSAIEQAPLPERKCPRRRSCVRPTRSPTHRVIQAKIAGFAAHGDD